MRLCSHRVASACFKIAKPDLRLIFVLIFQLFRDDISNPGFIGG